MDKLVDHLFVFKGDGSIQDFAGNYTDFRISINSSIQGTDEKVKNDRVSKPRRKEERKLSYKEKKEFETLERVLKELEEKRDYLSNLINSGETDHDKLISWGTQLEEVTKEIDDKESRWLVLAEIAG